MTAVLVDSDILIEILRQRDPAILETWTRLARGEAMIACTPVSVAEIWHGARAREEAGTRLLFSLITCLPIDEEIGRKAGEYLREYNRSHNLELGDSMIAATAVHHQLPIWTRNRKHYPMKPLRFFQPSGD